MSKLLIFRAKNILNILTKLKLNLQTVKFQFRETHLSINRVANLDELVDQVSDDEFNKDERLPYWAELWPSAIGLSRYVINNAELFYHKNILELGCGLGLTSIVLKQQKPASLLCTDYENDALELARKNFLQNRIRQPDFQYLDWRDPQLSGKYEIIIASDILYEERFFNPLYELFNKHLERHGCVIIAEPNRKIALSFFEKLKNVGYQYEIQFEEVDQDRKNIIVSVYRITK